MARFRGTVLGGRTEASRLGHKNTGLRVTANGWESGVQVSGWVDEDGVDRFDIYLTSGSSGRGLQTFIGSVHIEDGEPVFRPGSRVTHETRERLEFLRGQIRAERISYGELAELQGLAEFIEPGDVELLEWAGVPEFPDGRPRRLRHARAGNA